MKIAILIAVLVGFAAPPAFAASSAERWCQGPGSPLHLGLYENGFTLLQPEPYHRRFEIICEWIDRERLLAACERTRGLGTMGPEGRPDYEASDDPPVAYKWELDRFEVSANSVLIEWENGPGLLTFAPCE